MLGVSSATQARYVAEASQKVYATPGVDMLIHFLVRDDRLLAGWQSGVFTAGGLAKPSYVAFRLPLVQVSRRGTRTVLWGQVRPRAGSQTYRLRVFQGGRWRWVGSTRRTNARGAFSVVVNASRGAKFQFWSPRDRAYGRIVVVR